MLDSNNGERMFDTISPNYKNSIIMKSLFEAIGMEFDTLDNLIEDVKLQLFPQTASWGLKYWEERCGLPTNADELLQARRNKVIAKLQSKHIMNPKRMAMVLQKYTGADIKVIENTAPYTFEIDLIGRTSFPKSLEELYKTVKKIKPSHLSDNYKLISITSSSSYFGAISQSGEEVSVYPWSQREIVTRGKLNIGIGMGEGLEEVNLYPKKEEVI
ncbi:YmfQ family protein [Metaclostridioides mangenotii]|uniref:YmfQ family protein n=1 Tax=Metaclostridioides mangenotii TaxID=1540 RepID=UPI0026F2C3E8|nr:YmfQ family protein [Clostridioides mangenotii]